MWDLLSVVGPLGFSAVASFMVWRLFWAVPKLREREDLREQAKIAIRQLEAQRKSMDADRRLLEYHFGVASQVSDTVHMQGNTEWVEAEQVKADNLRKKLAVQDAQIQSMKRKLEFQPVRPKAINTPELESWWDIFVLNVERDSKELVKRLREE